MPVYEYECKHCDSLFEELLTSRADVQAYSKQHVCDCGKMADRVPSVANAVFKGIPGRSGSHDLDYPVLDKAVGRSAEKRWGVYNQRKEARDKVRKQSGSRALTVSGSNVAPTDPGKLALRQKAIQTFNKARKSNF